MPVTSGIILPPTSVLPTRPSHLTNVLFVSTVPFEVVMLITWPFERLTMLPSGRNTLPFVTPSHILPLAAACIAALYSGVAGSWTLPAKTVVAIAIVVAATNSEPVSCPPDC